MTIKHPTPDTVRDLSDRLGLTLAEKDHPLYAELMQGMV